MNTARTIILVDSDPGSCRHLNHVLGQEGFYSCSFRRLEDARSELQFINPSLVLLDVALDGWRGLDFLASLKSEQPSLPIIVISECKEPGVVVTAMKLGAEDFIQKPFDMHDLIYSIRSALEYERESVPVLQSQKLVSGHEPVEMIIGPSESMLQLQDLVEQVADTDIHVLIQGETGTGKELIARMLHFHSYRRSKAFVRVNCALIPFELLESELFGYEKGAFTGASQGKAGKFEFANGGTIFLDEISELPPPLQAKLLQVLQESRFSRLGGVEDIDVDVRMIASTNRNLQVAVSRKHFREDLFFRLNGLTIHAPPLRERKEEIPLLVRIFMDRFTEEFDRKPRPLLKKTMKAFEKYAWPGNVRELENMVKRVILFGQEDIIRQGLYRRRSYSYDDDPCAGEDFPGGNQYSLKEIKREAALKAEREAILEALKRSRWNRRKAADLLEVSYKALLYKMKQTGISNA